MKAIILASGEGSRLRPLTDTTPKPLLKILGKPLISYTLENLEKLGIKETIIVVKYKHELFQEILWESLWAMKLSYHLQGEKNGTAAALVGIDIPADKKILILYGDSLYPKKELKKVIESSDYGCLVQEVENPEIYGIFEEQNGKATRIIEKPSEDIGNLANMGGFLVNGSFLTLCAEVPVSSREEYEIPDALNIFVTQETFVLHRIEEALLDIGYSWNLLDANKHFLENLKDSDIQGTIEKNVHLDGNIILEEWAIIKSGSYIEGNCYFGKNSIIGPNAYVRGNTSLWEDSKIWFCVEVKNSYIGDHTKISHLSYLWDSVVGNHVNLGCGFKVANLRHDGKTHKVMVKEKLIDTGRRKFGCIIGDNTKAAINTQVYPGRVFPTGTTTIPWETIK